MPDWQRAFDDPIPLPNGGELLTLRDAANYITRLPKREHDAPAWRAAIEDRSSSPRTAPRRWRR